MSKLNVALKLIDEMFRSLERDDRPRALRSARKLMAMVVEEQRKLAMLERVN